MYDKKTTCSTGVTTSRFPLVFHAQSKDFDRLMGVWRAGCVGTPGTTPDANVDGGGRVPLRGADATSSRMAGMSSHDRDRRISRPLLFVHGDPSNDCDRARTRGSSPGDGRAAVARLVASRDEALGVLVLRRTPRFAGSSRGFAMDRVSLESFDLPMDDAAPTGPL